MKCPSCKFCFRVPEGEEMDHDCPRCGCSPCTDEEDSHEQFSEMSNYELRQEVVKYKGWFEVLDEHCEWLENENERLSYELNKFRGKRDDIKVYCVWEYDMTQEPTCVGKRLTWEEASRLVDEAQGDFLRVIFST